MSIINDAIKKARKESEMKDTKLLEFGIHTEGTGIKWTAWVIVSLVLVISLLCSIWVYKFISRSNIASNQDLANVNSQLSPTVSQTPKAGIFASNKNAHNNMELNGIVYGSDNKWAIINNKIFREGDPLLNGEVTLISKDSVKILKKNGEAVVLNLK